METRSAIETTSGRRRVKAPHRKVKNTNTTPSDDRIDVEDPTSTGAQDVPVRIENRRDTESHPFSGSSVIGITRRNAILKGLSTIGVMSSSGMTASAADIKFPTTLINPMTGKPGGTLRPVPDAGFLDRIYAWEEDRQHVGADFYANSSFSQTIYAIAPGEVMWIARDTAKDYNSSAIIILSTIGKVKRMIVYGHTYGDSKLKVGSMVKAGDVVGSLRKWGSLHFHLGLNSQIRISSMMPSSSFGWGRVPVSTSATRVAELGWIDPIPELTKLTSSSTTPSSALMLVTGSSLFKSGVELTITNTLRRARTEYMTVTFLNKGSDDLRPRSLSTTNSDVKLDGSLPSRIRAGETVKVYLALRPSRTGTQTYGVTIKWDGGEFKLGLRCTVK
jgi:murein DD-endopeptidase MepM/ murein hydrolase activator NlpD